MAAYAFLASKRVNRENHTTLSLLALAQSGDGKEIKKQLTHWEKES